MLALDKTIPPRPSDRFSIENSPIASLPIFLPTLLFELQEPEQLDET